MMEVNISSVYTRVEKSSECYLFHFHVQIHATLVISLEEVSVSLTFFYSILFKNFPVILRCYNCEEHKSIRTPDCSIKTSTTVHTAELRRKQASNIFITIYSMTAEQYLCTY